MRDQDPPPPPLPDPVCNHLNLLLPCNRWPDVAFCHDIDSFANAAGKVLTRVALQPSLVRRYCLDAIIIVWNMSTFLRIPYTDSDFSQVFEVFSFIQYRQVSRSVESLSLFVYFQFYNSSHKRHEDFMRGGRLKGRESSYAESASNLGGPWPCFPEKFSRKSVLSKTLGWSFAFCEVIPPTNYVLFWKLKKTFLFLTLKKKRGGGSFALDDTPQRRGHTHIF